MLKYTGNMKPEVSSFETHDNAVNGFLKGIATNIGQLNASWNDDVSHETLTSFNQALTDLNEALIKVHNSVGEYFTAIQNELNVWGQGQSVPLPSLETIETQDISASAGDGSIMYDENQVLSTLKVMENAITALTNKISEFKPHAVSLEGSDASIIDTIDSNLYGAASSYSKMETPLNEIKDLITKVRSMYVKKASNIGTSSATNGGGTGKDTVSYLES